MQRSKTILFSILFVFVLLNILSISTVKADPQIHVATSQNKAVSYEQVLVMVTSDPLPSSNNTTTASNHTIDFEFINLGSGEVIYSEEIKLISGTGTWSFNIDPNWGEFTGVVKVVDPQLNSMASTSIDIEYSTDYLLKVISDAAREEREEREAEEKADDDRDATIIGASWLLSWTLIPLVLFKIQHNNAHKNNEMSYWDRFIDRWDFSFTRKRLWNYFKDPRYHHSRDGMPYFKAGNLLATHDQIIADIEDFEKGRMELRQAIKELAPDMLEPEKGDDELIDMSKLEDN